MVSDPSRKSTWIDIVRWRAERDPQRLAFKNASDGGQEPDSLTYADLDIRARAIGGRLQHPGLAGERVLLLLSPGLEYLCAFLGCVYAGAVAVPLYPARRNRSMDRMLKIAIASDAGAAFVAETRSGSIDPLPGHRPSLSRIRRLTFDEVSAADPADWKPPNPDESDVVFLQFTSGSTSDPKGVMVTHRNLVENARLIEASFRHSPESILVTWLPPHHDMGLIGGILQPIYGGFPTTLLSAARFLQRPFRWLDTIARERATISGGPTFAYDLCAKTITTEERASLDLQSWTIAFCGSEHIRADTLRKFGATFAECGFRSTAFFPCYGLAEATLFVAGRSDGPLVERSVDGVSLASGVVRTCGDGDTQAKTLVSSGTVCSGSVVIVDPVSLSLRSVDQVGEIWVSGPNVAAGYWQQPSATEQTFKARVAGMADGPFLRTGDLGFIADDQLFVTGRHKELIIVRGQNFYPLDIEITVGQCHAALLDGETAAFSVEDAGEERLVIVHRLTPASQRCAFDEIIAAIRAALADAHDLEVHAILLTSARQLPHTSSGKLQRGACRDAYLANALPVSARWMRTLPPPATDLGRSAQRPSQPASGAIQSFIIERVAHQLGVATSQIDPDVPFKELGLDSVRTVAISGELEALIERRLSPTLLWEYPTIRVLAEHLSSETAEGRTIVVSRDRSSHGHDVAII